MDQMAGCVRLFNSDLKGRTYIMENIEDIIHDYIYIYMKVII